jgi:ATP-binding cassette subfamily B protein
MLSKRIDQVLQPIYKKRIPAIALKTVAILISILPPLLTGQILIDDLIYTGGQNALRTIGLIGIILLVYFFLSWAQDYYWHRMEYIGTGLVRSYIFANVIRKNYFFLKGRNIGDLENKIVHDAELYAHARLSSLPMLFLNILHIVVILAMLFYVSISMTLATMCFSAIFYIIYKLINRHLRRTALIEREGYSEVLTTTNEVLSGATTIQLYGGQDFFASRFEQTVDKYEHFLIHLRKWKGLAHSSTGTVVWLLPLVAVFVGLRVYQADIVTIGGITTFYLVLPHLAEPLKALTEFNIDTQNAKVVEARLAELLVDELHNGEDAPCENNLIKIDKIHNLQFSNICYKYGNGTEVLWDVNFAVGPGDALAIIGPSGAGKTTFLRMLKRQVNPSWGKILINGINMDNICEKSYLSRIAVLAQDVFVFNDSITENVKFGKDIPPEIIAEKIKLAALDHLDPDENAKNLSGGEIQRLGLARALACHYDILIMDEPTTELDIDTEAAIIQNLKAIQAQTNCIFIIVTHSEHILKDLCNEYLDLTREL